MTQRALNFSAGPAVLPEPVIKTAQSAIWNIDDTGVGIMEHSHRGAAFTKVLTEAEANVRELANIGDDHDVLFLQGGASTQFFMAPMNWLGKDQTADYLNTGAWSKKAMKEAKAFGTVNVVASSEDENFSYIPGAEKTKWTEGAAYAHFTSNNTIAGTQFATEPAAPAGTPLLCDASSDIFSRPVDIKKYGMLYAGAQKNLGPAGVALVIVRKDLVAKGNSDLPTMLQYRTHADKDSCFNTPPAFGIFIMGEVFKWIKNEGGLATMAEKNSAKAKILYDFLGESEMFRGTARPDSRSLMNITFRATSEELEAQFIKEAAGNGFSGLKGHRSVGGMRASIYNAFPAAGVTKLVEYMKSFEQANK